MILQELILINCFQKETVFFRRSEQGKYTWSETKKLKEPLNKSTYAYTNEVNSQVLRELPSKRSSELQ